MALESQIAPSPGLASLVRSSAAQRIALLVGVAAVIAIMAAVMLWSQKPDYRVLFSNFSDRDGGAIVASLQQMNVPYRFAEGGGAILVPAEQVHDARLKLASQGLPKGGSVGFELMENQKLGVSQFLEQVNFQRALEGELARSIQSIAAVQGARVHLALPKPSVFVRDQQKPTASVLVNLHAGRTLDARQVNAIVHLVASSVPDLPARNVTVVDQSGSLISSPDKPAGAGALDASQLKYVHELQNDVARRVEAIISPIVGPGNVHAEATAEVDFSHSEQAAETYRPNQAPDTAAVRSQQSSESQQGARVPASGVPGALSNQPPTPATAPVAVPAPQPAAAAPQPGATAPQPAGAAAAAPSQRDLTINYEVDKTIRYVQQPMGGLKRLSVAVVVNHRREVDAAGKVSMKPLSEPEKAQITELVKQAMGFNAVRGDSLSVANSAFAARVEPETGAVVPLWQRPGAVELAWTAGKYLLAALVLAYLFFAYLRPMLRTLTRGLAGPPALQEQSPAVLPEPQQVMAMVPAQQPAENKPRTYQENLESARLMARQDPRVVANVIRKWVGAVE